MPLVLIGIYLEVASFNTHTPSLPVMAKGSSVSIVIVIVLSLALVATASSNHHYDPYFQELTNTYRSSLTKLQVYIQAYFSNSDAHNQTVYPIAQAAITANSPTNFGQVIAIDNLVTSGPDPRSELIGRYQGMNTYSDFSKTATTMNMNLVFSSGAYSGSTISVVGRQPINEAVRALSIAGGTGFFQMAKGIVLASTHSVDPVKRSGTYLYDMYIVTPTEEAHAAV